jgi:hypothetical protein
VAVGATGVLVAVLVGKTWAETPDNLPPGLPRSLTAASVSSGSVLVAVNTAAASVVPKSRILTTARRPSGNNNLKRLRILLYFIPVYLSVYCGAMAGDVFERHKDSICLEGQMGQP